MRTKLLNSNAEWIRWGKEDPLWAVFTERNRERDGSAPWTGKEFYETGKSDWQDFVQRWRQYGVDPESCLEIGCGAGRITGYLSKSFHRVFAIDVSPEMIERARDRTAAADNVEFELTDGLALPYLDKSVKAVFSTHVLQHVDSAQIVVEYFREFFRVLEVGGTIMIHLPLYAWPNAGRIAWLLDSVLGTAVTLAQGLAWMKRRLGARMMRLTAVHVQSLHAELTELGFKDIEFRTFPVSRNGTLHSFVFARK